MLFRLKDRSFYCGVIFSILILLALGYYHENPLSRINKLKKAFRQGTPGTRH
jgi:hypothetical protein